MKAFTDINQSKKLTEILPLESADMCYRIVAYNPNDTHEYQPYCFVSTLESDIPCWSLSALLNVLDFAKCDIHKDIYGWKCYTWPNNWKYDSNWNDNPIDACYEMIIKLHEQKLM